MAIADIFSKSSCCVKCFHIEWFGINVVMSGGLFLQVRLVFEEPEPGVTVVKLTHTDVPEEDR